MKSAPLPANEKKRLEALYCHKILDTPPESIFDDLTKLAAYICNVPAASITLIDEDREWYKSKIGIDDEEAARDISFCAHTILDEDLFIVPDTLKDKRFFDNPFVTDDPPLRFYAAMPLITEEGHALGTLCVIDHVPRRLNKQQKRALKTLSRHIIALLKLRRKENELKQNTLTLKKTENIAQRYLTLFEQSPDAVLIIDPETTLPVEFNLKASELLGYSPEEFSKIPVSEYEANETPEEIEQHVQKVLRNGNDIFETRMRTKDGQIKHVIANIKVIEIDGRKFYHNIFHDITERKQIEKDLQLTKIAVERAADSIFWIKRNGDIYYFNNTATKILGYSFDELTSMSVFDFNHTYSKEAWNSHWKDIKKRKIVTYETEHTTSNNKKIPIEVTANFLKFNGLELVCFIGREITERKIAQQALVISEKRYRTIVETTNEWIWEFDISGHHTYSNMTIESILGYPLDEFLKKGAFQLMHEDEHDQVSQKLEECIKNKTGWKNWVIKWRHNNGSIRYLESNAVPKFSDNGDVVGFMGSDRDITERKLAEDAVIELGYKNELILNSAGEGIYEVDLEGRVTFINLTGANMIGWNKEELVGKVQHEIIHHTKSDGSPYPKKECPIYSVYKDGKVHTLNNEVFWRKDGSSFPVEYTSTPIKNSDDRIKGAVVVFRDISKHKKAEEALRSSETQLRLFVHETPAAVAMLDKNMRYIAYSKRWKSDYKLEDKNLIGRSHYEIFPEIPERWKKIHQQCLHGDVRSCEEDSFLRLDGSMEWLRWEVRPWHNNTGQIGGIIMLTENITSRKESDERLRMHQHIVSTTDDMLSFIDKNYVYREGNAAFFNFLNLDRKDVIGKRVDEISGQSIFEKSIKPFIHQCLEGKKFNFEFKINDRFYEVRYFPFPGTDGKFEGIVSSARDITEIRQINELVLKSRERLRNLTSRLYSIREQERTDIAREIHDGFGQSIAAIKIQYDWLNKKIEKYSINTEIQEQFKRVGQLIQDEMDKIRKFSSNLRPPVLDEFGLIPAIGIAIDEYRVIAPNINFRSNCQVNNLDFEATRDTTIFRVFQEAMTNAIQHANADLIKVKIWTTKYKLKLQVEDNGCGITNDQINNTRSLGIIGMRERIGELGGNLNILPGKAGGTLVEVSISIYTNIEQG